MKPIASSAPPPPSLASGKLINNAVRQIHYYHSYLWAAGEILLIPVVFHFGWRLARKALAYHRQTRQSKLENPPTPPDFSGLSDGSQMVKKLEEMK